jgi:isoleucyl-tRNA synthetase
MEALLKLVSLGSAARNTVKIKVRQPLAELKVQPGNEAELRAVERFADQIREELNVKGVTLHDPSKGPLLRQEVKPNMKTLGPKFGAQLKEVQAAIAAANPAAIVAKVQAGQPFELLLADGPVTLEPADMIVQFFAPEGWAGVVDRDAQVLIDTRITDELDLEGSARGMVRQIQDLRKKAGLEMEDRIVLYLSTKSPKLQAAIKAHRQYIADETLTFQWSTQPLGEGAHRATVKIDGEELLIELKKA